MYRLIIADDEAITIAAIQKIVGRHFEQIAVAGKAANGQQAIDRAVEANADIAILDIEMPLLNGIEAGRQIREQLSHCQVIYLTAYAEFEYARQAVTLGASDFLLKPIEEELLVQTLRRTMERLGSKPLQARHYTQAYESGGDVPAVAGDRAGKLALAARRYIDKRYMQDLSVESIAENLQISPNYFNRIFKSAFGIACMDHVIQVRMQRGRQLLEDPVLTIKEVSVLVGYSDANYFAKLFKKKVGLTPTEYRNRHFFARNV